MEREFVITDTNEVVKGFEKVYFEENREEVAKLRVRLDAIDAQEKALAEEKVRLLEVLTEKELHIAEADKKIEADKLEAQPEQL